MNTQSPDTKLTIISESFPDAAHLEYEVVILAVGLLPDDSFVDALEAVVEETLWAAEDIANWW